MKSLEWRRWLSVIAMTALLLFGAVAVAVGAGDGVDADSSYAARAARAARQKISQEEREAAAARIKLFQGLADIKDGKTERSVVEVAASIVPTQGGTPDYFGLTPNWAYSPLIRKFVDGLPGLGPSKANLLGQFIPVGKPDTITYPGCDYYEIELRQFTEQMHSDLPPTTLRGYVQVNKGTDANGDNTLDPDPIHYLGPFIMATKDRPVRIKFTNKLPTGEDGDLFIPVDTSVMGAGMGPLSHEEAMMDMPMGMDMNRWMNYTQNRATLHLHGGITPWISDGTPHQWITPAGEQTPYPKGVSVKNVPDMPDPGDGSMTFFYTNQQSARLMFYHDHSYGITRLNVYAGEAAGYMITDDAEKKLIADGTVPAEQIPLIIQDKTFVDSSTVLTTDPTWNWGTGAKDANGYRQPVTGDLWLPHVYVPAQNPADPGGMNATGRWHYSPWFWPPVTNIQFPPIPNPYYDPVNAPWEPELMPATPNPSMGMEAFHDTPIVNGTAYPTVELQPKSYRFRVLNAASDRFWNLQMYVADGSVTTSDNRTNTEVKMVPASITQSYFPELWPMDGRVGGVPDPRTAGPDWIQIATEGGFLPAPAIIPQQPITWNGDPTTFNAGNVQDHALLLGPAERADVIVDFSQYAGKTLILYNDAPAAFPALDPRMDYFTGAPDLRDTGGTLGAEPGFGPSTRTIMQIKIADTAPAQPFDLDGLNAAFASTNERPGVFASSQNPVIVPDSRYNSAYNASFTVDPYVRIWENTKKFKTIDSRVVTVALEPKAIQDETSEVWDTAYGRMSGKLGLEMPRTNAGNANFIMYSYFDPATENLQDSMTPLSPVGEDGTQLWKITHNGVDTHPIHFHLFDVQVINRVGWDNGIRPPDDNELGWKDTVRVSPLEDTIVALKPVAPKLEFGVPKSIRLLDPTMPEGHAMGFSNLSPIDGQPLDPPVTNQMVDFEWEYVWHCHILSHEEMDMMRPMTLSVTTTLPAAPALAGSGLPGSPIDLIWTDATPAGDPLTFGNPANEIGFRIERAEVTSQGVESTYTVVGAGLANSTTYRDTTTIDGKAYRYKVVAFNASGEVASNAFTFTPPLFFDSYTITPVAGPGGAIVPGTPQIVPAGSDSVTFTITPNTGYRIVDVLVDGVSVGVVGEYKFLNVGADHAIWATFARNTYQIVPSAGANGSISPATTQTVDYGADSAAFTITPNTGYHIADVLVDGVSVGAVSTYTFTNVTANHTISATFAINTYTITPSAGVNGSISPNTPQFVNHGANSTAFTITPNTGYHIADVLVDGVSVGAVSTYTFTNVTANHTIAASFAIDTFTITPSAGAGGSIAPSTAQSVAYGSNSAFTITPNTGYHIADVLVDGVSVGAVSTYTFTNVTANHTIAASFAIDTYTITATAGAGGSIAPAGVTTVNHGSNSPTFTVTPDPGFYLASLKVDGAAVAPVLGYAFANVTANHTIEATFSSKVIGRYSRDSIGNAIATATQNFPGWTGVTDVVIATADSGSSNQFEAAVAPGLAGAYNAPLLLVSKTALRTDVRNALIAMPNGIKVHVVGTTAAINSTVYNALRAVPGVASVDRVYGADRFGTAAAVARRMKLVMGDQFPTTVIITSAQTIGKVGDTIAATPVSARNKFPILYVTSTTAPTVTLATLNDLGLTERYVIGGVTTISDTVRSAVGVPTANRISGPDAYSTATELATKAYAMGWLAGARPGFGVIGPETNWAGATMGLRNGPILFVTSTSVPASTGAYLTANKASITGGYLFGSTAVVSEGVRLSLLSLIQ